MTSTDRSGAPLSQILTFVGGVAVLALLVILADLVTLAPGETLTREGGGIETVSMLGYLVTIAVYVWKGPRVPFWPVPVLLLAMALREFDADKRFTSEGILSTKILFYDTPIWEKVLAIGVWVLLVAALVTLIRKRGLPFLTALRRRAAWAVAFLAGLLIAAFSKSIDGLGRKLLSVGIEVSEEINRNAGTLEELLELFIPILFMVAIFLRADPTDR